MQEPLPHQPQSLLMLHSTQERLREWHTLLESGGAVTGGEVDTEGAEVDAGGARGHTLEHDESLQQE
jgi:hypothetical protein